MVCAGCDRFIVVTQRRSRRHYVVVEPVCAWILGVSLSRQMVADLRSRACAVWCLRSPPSRSSQEELCARLGGDRKVNLVALFTDRHDALDPHPAIGADKLDRSRPPDAWLGAIDASAAQAMLGFSLILSAWCYWRRYGCTEVGPRNGKHMVWYGWS